MPNLEALDTAIAMVIVILLLSLIVQSIQSLFKKLLKIKSRHLEQSLVDLFQNVLAKQTQGAGSTSGKKASFLKSPMMQMINPRGQHPADQAGGDAKELYGAVVKRFKEIGRVSASGKHMLDSISKGDLIKVLRSVAPNTLLPNLLADLQNVCAEINALTDALNSIDIKQLSGETSAKFAALHEALAPVLSDMQCIMSGRDLKPELVLGDVMNLRQINLDDVLTLLGEVQKKVKQDLESESKRTDGESRAKALKDVAKKLGDIAGAIIAVRRKFDSAVAPLRTKLNEVEVWYDTVMHSFEERYTRGMKTWAIVISVVVVIVLNANFFDIYQNIATNDVTRNLVAQAAPELLARSKAATSSNTTVSSDQTERPAPAPSPNQTSATTTIASPPASAATTDKTSAQTPEDVLASLRSIRAQLKSDVDTYAGLGFSPLKWAQVRHWASTLPPSEKDWLMHRKHDLRTLLGWIITILLLSVGAPFWQDTLESLFGVKSLLRKRGEIRNVETASGAGNPKP